MSSDFFQTLFSLMDGVDKVTLSITKSPTGILSVSTLPTSNTVKDKAFDNIRPLHITGTADELDIEYFSLISSPVQAVGALYKNVTHFEASVEQARIDSEMEKKKLDKEKKAADLEKKAKEENSKKVATVIEEAEEMLKAKDFTGALKVLIDIEQQKLLLSKQSESLLTESIAKVKQQNPQAELF